MVSQKIGKFTPGFGFDRVSANSGSLDQFFANLIYENTPNDYSALVFANQKHSSGKEVNKARFVLGHHGSKESWGHRSFLECDWDNKGEKSVTAHSIVSPFGPSTFVRISNQLLSENTFFNDDSFKLTRTPYALYTEEVPVYGRLYGDNVAENGFNLKGLGFMGDYSLKRNQMGECAVIGGRAVYVGRLSKNVGHNEAGVSIGAVYERNYGVATTSLTGGATIRLGKHFSVGGSVKAPLNQRGYNPSANIWAEVKF